MRDEPKSAPPRAYFLKILTIAFRYGAQHDLDQHARCRSTATDIWKLALTAQPPAWPDSARTCRSANRTRQPTRRSPLCARRKGVSRACASPMAPFAHVARRAEHTPAARNVFFVPLRGGRGGQLGENWARPLARGPSGKRKGLGRFWPPHQADGRSKMGARDAIGDTNGAPTKHRAGAMISTQPVANAG